MSMRIFKTFWNGKWIFEGAFCNACEKAFNEGYSEESKRHLAEWWGKKQPFRRRHPILELDHCGRCEERVSIAPGNSLQLTAMIEDGEIFWAQSLCGRCLLEAEECYSDETRGFRDRFLEKLLTPPVGGLVRCEPVLV